MLKKRIESMIAILIILIVGLCYQATLLSRTTALTIAIAAFALSQGIACYLKYKRNEEWQRMAVWSITFLLILFVMLFL